MQTTKGNNEGNKKQDGEAIKVRQAFTIGTCTHKWIQLDEVGRGNLAEHRCEHCNERRWLRASE